MSGKCPRYDLRETGLVQDKLASPACIGLIHGTHYKRAKDQFDFKDWRLENERKN